jgi:RNA polymerase sigma-70 factor (ECF subfamily)
MATFRVGTGTPTQADLGVCVTAGASDTVNKLERQIADLYDTLRVPVFRYLVSLGVAIGEADEILQETFLRAYRHLQGGKDNPNLRAWVFRVAHNLAINHHKKQRWSLGLIDVETYGASFPIIDPSPNAEEILLRKERLQRIGSALHSLTAQEMQCIQLRAEGFRYREIADIAGIGISTVADSLRRALTKLTGEEDA